MPSITQKPLDRSCGFINQMYPPVWFVVHFTGGTPNLQSLYNYWLSQCGVGSNSHFGIERTDNQWARAGDIWQFLPLTDGACANCCSVSGACAPFLPPGQNYNTRTISVECINPDSSNAGLCTGAQYDSLVWLIRDICQKLGISTTKYSEYTNSKGMSFTFGDGGGGVIMHRDFDQVNRARCPGMDVYEQQMKQIMIEVNFQEGNFMSNPEYVKQLHPDSINQWLGDRWRAMYRLMNEGRPADQQLVGPPENTGIFGRWKEEMLSGNDVGAALGWEYQVGWHYVQDFSNAQISYDNRPTSPQPSRYNILPGSEK